MQLKLHFYDSEIREFLKARGYSIFTVNCSRAVSEYHGNVTFQEIDVEVATKKSQEREFSDFFKSNDEHDIRSKFGIESVFSEEIKSALLNLPAID